MSPSDDARDAFTEARRRPPAERETWLAERCGDDTALFDEVRDLLASDDADWTLLDTTRAFVPTESPLRLPLDVGDYRLVRWLGAGATGTVFEALHVAHARRVALKLLKPLFLRSAVRRRFDQEGALLERLDHAAIARVSGRGELDVGFGRVPFLEMELVDGAPLDVHCEREDLSSHDVLDLIEQVAEGVAYAHERGVVHRDLKPANIVVDSTGRPKLLDFGVARADLALHEASQSLHTETGQLLGTLQYMSPEQARGDLGLVDERTDLYALGIIAYELLAQRPPYRVDGLPLASAIERIGRVEPPPLSSYCDEVSGELERVLAMAVEKDVDDRHASVRAWLDDLRRARRGVAVRARAPSVWRQLRKLTRRHPVLVRSVVGGGAVLSSALALVTWAWWDANEQKRIADAALESELALREELVDTNASLVTTLDDANSLIEFLDVTWASFDAIDGERAVTARDVFDRAAASLAGSTLAPGAAVRLHTRLATAYWKVGFEAPAEEQWEAAMEILETRLPASHPDALAARFGAIEFWLDTNHVKGRAAWEALEALNDEVAFTPWQLTRLRQQKTAFRDATGEASDAEVERVLEDLSDVEGASDEVIWRRLVVTRLNQARAWLDAGRWREAVESVEELRAETLERDGPDALTSLSTLNTLGRAYFDAGRLDDAVAVMRACAAGFETNFGAEHPNSLTARTNLAIYLNLIGETDEAKAAFDQAMESDRVTGNSRGHALRLMNQGIAALGARNFEAADPLLVEALAGMRARVGDDTAETVRALKNLAQLRLLQDRVDDAHTLLDEALATSLAQGYEGERAFISFFLSLVHARRGDGERALRFVADAVTLGDATLPPGDVDHGSFVRAHAQLLECLGQPRAAFDVYRRALELGIGREQGYVEGLATAGLGRTLLVLGERDTGRALLEEALVEYSNFRLIVTECHLGLAQDLAAHGEYEEAALRFASAHANRTVEFGETHLATIWTLLDWHAALEALGRGHEVIDELVACAAALRLDTEGDVAARLARLLQVDA